MKLKAAGELERLRRSLAGNGAANGKRQIVLSADSTCCLLRGSKAVAEAFRAELDGSGLAASVGLKLAGCLGFCEIEPMVILSAGTGGLTEDLLYQRVQAGDVAEIVSERAIAHGMKTSTGLLGPDELAQVGGMFISLSTVGIIPVLAVDGTPLPQAPAIALLASDLLRLMDSECSRAPFPPQTR